MKYLATSVPRSVRSSRLGHLRTDAIIGTWHIPNPAGGFQVFDVLMQGEADFIRTKNLLGAPSANPSMPGQMHPPYVLKDIRQLDVPESDPNPQQTAAAHFRAEFKIS